VETMLGKGRRREFWSRSQRRTLLQKGRGHLGDRGKSIMLCVNKAYACGTLNLCFALSSWTLCVGFVETGWSDGSGVAIEGVCVKVTSIARYGVSSSVLERLVFGCS
jgi:hypothetical protein